MGKSNSIFFAVSGGPRQGTGPRPTRSENLPIPSRGGLSPANVFWGALRWRGTGPRPTVDEDSSVVRHRPIPNINQTLALRDASISRYRSAGACPPRTFLGRPGRGEGQALALREKAWQFPNQPHRLHTHMHHLPNQPHNILRIHNIRIRDNPTPIRIGFHAIPIDHPL